MNILNYLKRIIKRTLKEFVYKPVSLHEQQKSIYSFSTEMDDFGRPKAEIGSFWYFVAYIGDRGPIFVYAKKYQQTY